MSIVLSGTPQSGQHANLPVFTVDDAGNTTLAGALLLTQQAVAPVTQAGVTALYVDSSGQVQLVGPNSSAASIKVPGNLTVGGSTFTADTQVFGTLFAAGNAVVGSTTALGDNGVGELQLANVTTEATTNPTGGVLLYSNSTGQLKWRDSMGMNPFVGGTLSTTTATTTIANTAALTGLQSFTIKAGDPITGSTYRMQGYGVFSVTATPTLTFTLFWGGIAGTVITAMPAVTATNNITNAPFRYDALVNFRSTTSCTAFIKLNIATSAATSAVASFFETPNTPTTVATNVDSDFTMGFTWSAASASNTISRLGGNVELVR